MRIIREQSVQEDVEHLREAWAQPETFVYIPRKSELSLEDIQAMLATLPEAMHTEHFILLTSGSTGQPKFVVGLRQRSEALARILHKEQDSESIQETVLALPLTYCYAFVNQWLWADVHQRTIRVTEGFARPEAFRSTLHAARDAMLCLVGVQVPLLERYFAQDVFPGITRLHFAGGRFPQEKLDDVHRLFPNAEIYNNYGCAEAMPRLSIRRGNEANEAGNIGFPLEGIAFRTDESGALLFQSPYGAVAFIDQDGFHAISPEDWVATGDIAEANEDGTWSLLGRANEVFKRHGEKISLSRILKTINAHWHGQAAFFREPDKYGEEGHVLVLAPEADDAQVRTLLRALRTSHPRAHWPLRVESTSAIPMLQNGKVNTLALPDMEGKQIHWYQRI